MNGVIGLILIFGALLISVYLSNKTKVNLGFFTMISALLIGMWIMKIPYNKVISYFPIPNTMVFILTPLFFGYIRRAGVMDKIGQNVLYKFRKKAWMVPIAVYLASLVITACGGLAVIGFVIGGLAYALALQCGIPTWFIALSMFCAMTQFPYLSTTQLYATIVDTHVPGLGQPMTYTLTAVCTVVLLCVFIVGFIVSKSYKIGKDINLDLIKKPEPYTPKQKKVLFILVAFIAMALVPSLINILVPNPVTTWITTNLSVYILCALGTCIMFCMDIDEPSKVVMEDIPWSMILMLAGTSMLLGLLNECGAIDVLTVFISGLPVNLVYAALAFAGGILTMFCNGIVTTQLLAPICLAVSTASGLSFAGFFCITVLGASGPAISPFSGAGASLIALCPNELKDKQSKQQLIIAFILLGAYTLLGLTGIFKLIG